MKVVSNDLPSLKTYWKGDVGHWECDDIVQGY